MRNFILIALLIFSSCNREQSNTSTSHKAIITQDHTLKSNRSFDTVRINCDSLYYHKRYEIALITPKHHDADEERSNALFEVKQILNGGTTLLVKDSIYNRIPEVKFVDYNGDGVKDILVQNYSDVRSNLTYYLYLADTSNNRFKRIKGFNDIKNPRYLPKYDLIDNYVVSGTNWTDFYKIEGDSVRDFNVEVDESGHYKKEYNKALKEVLYKQRQNK